MQLKFIFQIQLILFFNEYFLQKGCQPFVKIGNMLHCLKVDNPVRQIEIHPPCLFFDEYLMECCVNVIALQLQVYKINIKKEYLQNG
jgi:hypothetical protein